VTADQLLKIIDELDAKNQKLLEIIKTKEGNIQFLTELLQLALYPGAEEVPEISFVKVE